MPNNNTAFPASRDMLQTSIQSSTSPFPFLSAIIEKSNTPCPVTPAMLQTPKDYLPNIPYLFLYEHWCHTPLSRYITSACCQGASHTLHYFLFASLFFSSASASSFARSLVLTWIIHVSKPSPLSFDVVTLTYFSSALYVKSGNTARFMATCPLGSARSSRRTACVSLFFSRRSGPTP